MMTKQDFIAHAKIIREATGSFDAVHVIALALADYYAAANPRFDRARFLTACGVEKEES